MTWFDESLYAEWGDQGYTQRFKVSEIVYEVKSGTQNLVVFETPYFGRVLALDGIIQTTERDEFAYHEMLAHVPLFAHGAVEDALIIGGGDGGALREVLRHNSVRRVTLVEIDQAVVDSCRKFLPSLSNGAFDDPRVSLIFEEGSLFLSEITDQFDVIIVDSTDPIGSGEALFTEAFYAKCQSSLKGGGILITQNGVPFIQPEELKTSRRRLERVFMDVSFYLTVVPTYIGGFMALGWATDQTSLRMVPMDTLSGRFMNAGIDTRYYSPEVHKSAFILPPFIKDLIG